MDPISKQDFFEDRMIICHTSFVDSDLKVVNKIAARLVSTSCAGTLEFAFPSLE